MRGGSAGLTKTHSPMAKAAAPLRPISAPAGGDRCQGAQREGPESKPLSLVRLAQRLSLTAWMLITPRGRHKGGPDTPPTLSLSSLTPHLHCGLGAWHCSRACLPLASEWCPEWCPPGSAVPAPSKVAFECFNWDQ